MSFLENLWLLIIPVFLVGLVVGWWKEKVAGFLVCVPIVLGFLAALVLWENVTFVMTLPLIPGGLYLYYAYAKR